MYDAVVRRWNCTSQKQVIEYLNKYKRLCDKDAEVVAKWKNLRDEYKHGKQDIETLKWKIYNDEEIPSIDKIDSKTDELDNSPLPTMQKNYVPIYSHNMMDLEVPMNTIANDNNEISAISNDSYIMQSPAQNKTLNHIICSPHQTPPRVEYTCFAREESLKFREHSNATKHKNQHPQQGPRCEIPAPDPSALLNNGASLNEHPVIIQMNMRLIEVCDKNKILEEKVKSVSERLLLTEKVLVKTLDSQKDLLFELSNQVEVLTGKISNIRETVQAEQENTSGTLEDLKDLMDGKVHQLWGTITNIKKDITALQTKTTDISAKDEPKSSNTANNKEETIEARIDIPNNAQLNEIPQEIPNAEGNNNEKTRTTTNIQEEIIEITDEMLKKHAQVIGKQQEVSKGERERIKQTATQGRTANRSKSKGKRHVEYVEKKPIKNRDYNKK